MSDYFILSFTKKLLGMLEASYDTRRLPTPVTRETLMYHIELSNNKVGIKPTDFFRATRPLIYQNTDLVSNLHATKVTTIKD